MFPECPLKSECSRSAGVFASILVRLSLCPWCLPWFTSCGIAWHGHKLQFGSHLDFVSPFSVWEANYGKRHLPPSLAQTFPVFGYGVQNSYWIFQCNITVPLIKVQMRSSQRNIQQDRFYLDLHAVKPRINELVPALWLEMHYSMLHAKPWNPLNLQSQPLSFARSFMGTLIWHVYG